MTRPATRVDEEGKVEYLDVHDEPMDHDGQTMYRRQDRYESAIRESGESFFIPDSLADEFWSTTGDDTLSAVANVLLYLEGSFEGRESELSKSDRDGLRLILSQCSDQIDKVLALQAAKRASESH